jgi:hypothetical protein
LTRVQAVSSVGNEASARPKSCDDGDVAAEDTAGTMVGAEGRACGDGALAEAGHAKVAVARRRISESEDLECGEPKTFGGKLLLFGAKAGVEVGTGGAGRRKLLCSA